MILVEIFYIISGKRNLKVPLVKLTRVRKTYSSGLLGVAALKDINLEFFKGEIAAIVGPSGSGKSTLLHLIGALDQPTHGEIQVAGKTLGHMSSNHRAEFRLRYVGIVFQAYNLISVLTAQENIEYVQLLQGISAPERKKRALELLDRVGLSKYQKVRPTELSGGEQQRVAVARALAARPPLILADEPTANLDSKTGSDLIHLFKDLNHEYHSTFIVASHDPMVIDQMPRIIDLHDGEVRGDSKRIL